MRVLAVIPARAGSKRLPDKNIKQLGGKPLIAWTIEVALATCEGGVLVTTDGPEIASIATAHGAMVTMRPPELSQDDTPTRPVIQHAASKVIQSGEHFDAVAVLQPTSPFRNADDVRAAIRVMADRGADSVISVVPLLDDDSLFTIGLADRLRPAASAQAQIHTPNGAIYLVTRDLLASGESWYGVGAYAYVMPPLRSFDIDTRDDFDAARAMLEGSSR